MASDEEYMLTLVDKLSNGNNNSTSITINSSTEDIPNEPGLSTSMSANSVISTTSTIAAISGNVTGPSDVSPALKILNEWNGITPAKS